MQSRAVAAAAKAARASRGLHTSAAALFNKDLTHVATTSNTTAYQREDEARLGASKVTAWTSEAHDGPGHHRDPDAGGPWPLYCRAKGAPEPVLHVGEPLPASFFPGADAYLSDLADDRALIISHNSRGRNPNAGPHRTMAQRSDEDVKALTGLLPPGQATAGYARWRTKVGSAAIDNETVPSVEAKL